MVQDAEEGGMNIKWRRTISKYTAMVTPANLITFILGSFIVAAGILSWLMPEHLR